MKLFIARTPCPFGSNVGASWLVAVSDISNEDTVQELVRAKYGAISVALEVEHIGAAASHVRPGILMASNEELVTRRLVR